MKPNQYDINALQAFETTIEDGDLEYPITHHVLLNDQATKDFYQDLTNDEAEADETERDLIACANFYDAIAQKADGIVPEGEDLPDDWKTLIPREHKKEVIGRIIVLNVQPLKKADKPIDLRGWRQKPKSDIKRQVRVVHGDNVVNVSFTLKPVDADAYDQFLKAQNATLTRRIEIFQKSFKKLCGATEGYPHGVPLLHQFLITQYHLSKATLTEKN